jgi:hypothetical protein
MMIHGYDMALRVVPFNHRGLFETRIFEPKVAPPVSSGYCAAQFGPRRGPEYTYPSTPRN